MLTRLAFLDLSSAVVGWRRRSRRVAEQPLVDKAVGTALLAISVVVFVYYTLWAIVTVRAA